MKKILSIVLLIAFLSISAKESKAQNGKFGIKGGATAYSLTTEFGDFEATTDRKIGFEAGIFGDFPISEILSIQAEAVYVQKGGEESDDTFGNSSATLSYVDVPLLLKIHAPLEGAVKPYIFGGGYAGYLIEATNDEEGASEDITDFIDDFNYGLKLGAGVHIGSFVLDARYDMGLANLFSGDTDMEQIGDFKVTTSGVIVTLGISF